MSIQPWKPFSDSPHPAYQGMLEACRIFVANVAGRETALTLPIHARVEAAREAALSVTNKPFQALFSPFQNAITRKNHAEVSQTFHELQTHYPDHPQVINKMAEHFFDQKMFDDLEKLSEKISWGKVNTYFRLFEFLIKSFIFNGQFSWAEQVYRILLPHASRQHEEILCFNYLHLKLCWLHLGFVKEGLSRFPLDPVKKYIIQVKYTLYRAYIDASFQIDLAQELKVFVEHKKFHSQIEQFEGYLGYLCMRGQVEGALHIFEQLKQALNLECYQKKVLEGMGKCYLLKNDLAQALKYFKEGVSQKEFPLYEALAWEYAQDNPLEKILALILDESKNIKKGSKKECLTFLKACYRQGYFEEAHKLEEKILAAFPQLSFMVIKIYVAQGKSPLELIKNTWEKNQKNGSFLCEVARLHLNPTLPHFDLKYAEELLNAAIVYTHQDGDIGIELLRLHLIKHGIQADVDELVKRIMGVGPSYGELWHFYGHVDGKPIKWAIEATLKGLREEMEPLMPIYEEAKAGRQTSSSELFFTASPSFCQAVKAGLTTRVNLFIKLEMLFHNLRWHSINGS